MKKIRLYAGAAPGMLIATNEPRYGGAHAMQQVRSSILF